MTLDIRQLTPDDLQDSFLIRAQAFNFSPARFERARPRMRPERMISAFEGERMVGTATTFDIGQYFGGRSVPMGAVAGVAVVPERRGAGVGRQMLRVLVDQMRERGEVISTLYPATTVPYRRTGWEVAGSRAERRVALRVLTALPPPTATSVRLGSVDDLPGLAPNYDDVARTIDGFLARTEHWWGRSSDYLSGAWGEGDHHYLYVAERDGEVVGHVMYHHAESTGEDEWYSLEVHELVARDLDATLALWRVVAGNSSVSVRVTYHAGPDEPLTLLLPEQDIVTKNDWRWMTRLVDAPGAIAARGYAPGLRATVHLDISDDFAPWNTGRFVLEVADGEGRLTAGGDGSVRATINGLAPLYTGMASPWALARHGFLDGGSADDLAALAAVFAGPGPWMADFF